MDDIPRRLHALLRQRGGLGRPNDSEALAENFAAVLSGDQAVAFAHLLERGQKPAWWKDSEESPEVSEILTAAFSAERKEVARFLREIVERRELLRRFKVVFGKKGEVT